jgi:uncharacterized protein YdhG (YjbR/CyaY superfamily)
MQKFTYGTKASDFGDAILGNYLAIVNEPSQSALRHVYAVALELVPEAEEAVYYGMPCLKYQGKGLVAAMATQNFLSLYPFSGLERLGVDLSGFETTKGSVHFSAEHPIPDALLERIITARLHAITRA